VFRECVVAAGGPRYGFGTVYPGIGEAKQLQIRADAFNVFNHMVPVSYGSSMAIGSIANSPRIMQLAVKFRF